jgi:hypothetical protein
MAGRVKRYLFGIIAKNGPIGIVSPDILGQQLGLRYLTPAGNNRARPVHDTKMSLF